MKGFRTYLAIAVLLTAAALTVHAQEFRFLSRTIQVHGYGSQGFAYSNENNFLTMDTSHGSPAFTEGAVNLSTNITDKFRVGAQAYDRKIGSLDDGRPQLDWAYGDYKFKPFFGIRIGKVKTAIGLYNDTQDMEFLHTWALLPQGVYPTDLRSTMIAHTGGDVYGRIGLKKAGKLDYTGYWGYRPFDDREGYNYYSLQDGFNIEQINGKTEGWDLRWTTPIKGLMLGGSWASLTMHRRGQWIAPPFLGSYYTIDSKPDRPWVGYGDYNIGKFEFSGEYRAVQDTEDIVILGRGLSVNERKDNEEWFAAAAYRVTPKLQIGVYHSHLHLDFPSTPSDTASNHIYDEVGTARYDINRFWEVKAEGHFMDGYADSHAAQGFYTQWNPNGLKPKTNLLVLRTSMNF